MSGWAHPSRDLFRAGRGAMAPTATNRERVRARLAAKLGAAAMGTAITTTSPAASAGAAGGVGTVTKGGGLALFAKITASIVILGGVASIAMPRLLSRHDPVPAVTTTAFVEPASAPSSTSHVAPVATTTNTISVDDLPSAPKAHAPAGPKKTTASDPAEEARMVARIDDALRSADPARALALADEHAKKFPNGVLVEEREGGRAIARCMNGSRSSADAFLAAHPRSPMRGRILAACGTKE